jgi:hypothetical protein
MAEMEGIQCDLSAKSCIAHSEAPDGNAAIASQNKGLAGRGEAFQLHAMTPLFFALVLPGELDQ